MAMTWTERRTTVNANDLPIHVPDHDPVHVLYHLVATTVKVITRDHDPDLDLDLYHALHVLKVGNDVIVEGQGQGQDLHREIDTDITAIETGGLNQDLAHQAPDLEAFLREVVKGDVDVMEGEA